MVESKRQRVEYLVDGRKNEGKRQSNKWERYTKKE